MTNFPFLVVGVLGLVLALEEGVFNIRFRFLCKKIDFSFSSVNWHCCVVLLQFPRRGLDMGTVLCWNSRCGFWLCLLPFEARWPSCVVGHFTGQFVFCDSFPLPYSNCFIVFKMDDSVTLYRFSDSINSSLLKILFLQVVIKWDHSLFCLSFSVVKLTGFVTGRWWWPSPHFCLAWLLRDWARGLDCVVCLHSILLPFYV